MRNTGPWIAFLTMLFAIVGLCGLFASYAASIPLERALARNAVLEEALTIGALPDGAGRLQQLRPRLASLAEPVIDAPGPLPDRVARARGIVAEEQRREQASVNHRTRLMLGVVTVLAAGLGGGILMLVGRDRAQSTALVRPDA